MSKGEMLSDDFSTAVLSLICKKPLSQMLMCLVIYSAAVNSLLHSSCTRQDCGKKTTTTADALQCSCHTPVRPSLDGAVAVQTSASRWASCSPGHLTWMWSCCWLQSGPTCRDKLPPPTHTHTHTLYKFTLTHTHTHTLETTDHPKVFYSIRNIELYRKREKDMVNS